MTTLYGVGDLRTHDELHINLDMESLMPKYDTTNNNLWKKGVDGYVLLTINSIAWNTSYTLIPATDNIWVDLKIAGFDSDHMTQPVDGSAVPITNYLISTSSGSVTFSGGNVAKYVWSVRDGQPVSAYLNDDGTFDVCAFMFDCQDNNQIPAANPMQFTITYSLTFVDLSTATLPTMTTALTASLTVDDAQSEIVKFITTPVLANSGYIVFKLGQVVSSSDNAPPRTSPNFNKPHVTYDDPPIYNISLVDGSVFHSQYAARHTRTKVIPASAFKYIIWAVNQGKIDAGADNVDQVYTLLRTALDRVDSDDNATVTISYGLVSTSV